MLPHYTPGQLYLFRDRLARWCVHCQTCSEILMPCDLAIGEYTPCTCCRRCLRSLLISFAYTGICLRRMSTVRPSACCLTQVTTGFSMLILELWWLILIVRKMAILSAAWFVWLCGVSVIHSKEVWSCLEETSSQCMAASVA